MYYLEIRNKNALKVVTLLLWLVDVCCLNIDAFRERQVHKNTFRRDTNDHEEISESTRRLQQWNWVEKESLQLFKNARWSQYRVYRREQQTNSWIFCMPFHPLYTYIIFTVINKIQTQTQWILKLLSTSNAVL